MADIVLHESILALGTEGYFYGDGTNDVRYPHWPKGQSGVSIGVGFDIGASKITPEELTTVMSTLGVPDVMIKELAKTVNVTGEAAKALLISLDLRNKVRLTQQQALDIMLIIKQKTGGYVRRGFSKSYSILHPAILEALNKISYGAPALITGWKEQNFKGLGTLYDAEMAEITNHIKQCDLFLKMMDTMKSHAWVNSDVQEIHGTRVPSGLSYFISKVKTTLESGGTVTIQKGPITIEELLLPNNPTLDFASDVSNNTHAGGMDAKALRKDLQTARDKEPFDLKALCDKMGCKMPPLSGTTLNDDTLASCYKAMNPKKDLFLLKAQEQLVKLGYYDKADITGGMSNADGSYGGKTKKVLELYQKDNQLSITGLLDAETKTKLLNSSGSTPNNNNNENNNSQQNGATIFDWTTKIFEHLTQFQKEMEEKGSEFIGWVKDKITDLYDEFDNDPQTDSNSFWSLVQQTVQKITGGNSNATNVESTIELLKSALKGKGSISDSVGEAGKNNKADVLIVRALLTNAGYHDKNVWKEIKTNLKSLSTVDAALIQNIKKFQSEKASMNQPDGRIDAGGASLKILNGDSTNNDSNNNSNNQNTNPIANKTLSASVGKNGINTASDVLLVQQLLNKKGGKLTEDGEIGFKTIAAISAFQQKVFGSADGLITPGKRTWLALVGSDENNATVDVVEVVPTSLDAAVFPCFN